MNGGGAKGLTKKCEPNSAEEAEEEEEERTDGRRRRLICGWRTPFADDDGMDE